MIENRKSQPCVFCKGTMTLGKKTDTVEFAGNTRDVEVLGYWCDSCEEAIVEREGARAFSLAYAELKADVQKVLGPASIRRIREKLGLSQRHAGELLGGGARSFYKYETGDTASSIAMTNLLDILDKVPEAQEYFLHKANARTVAHDDGEKPTPDSHP